jgi:hypothetical protein
MVTEAYVAGFVQWRPCHCAMKSNILEDVYLRAHLAHQALQIHSVLTLLSVEEDVAALSRHGNFRRKDQECIKVILELY